MDKVAKHEEQKVEKVIEALYDYYMAHAEQMSALYQRIAEEEGEDRAVTDYISGMSDDFAIRSFEQFYVPKRWHVL